MTETGTGSAAEGAAPGLDPGTWRLAVVAGVRMDMPGEYPEVLVHEAVSPWRELAIPVGMAEGNAIAYAWRGIPTPRPLTHALFAEVLERHEVQLEAVRITARRGRSFFAELDTAGPRGRQVISCRPSDALAMVLRQRLPTPVLVADWVFDPEVTESTQDTAVTEDTAVTQVTATPPPEPEPTHVASDAPLDDPVSLDPVTLDSPVRPDDSVTPDSSLTVDAVDTDGSGDAEPVL
jgi:bifunctional DNase/RNase